jgi:SHS2 domain-containing protein
MPYRYVDDVATADVAFEAWGETVEDLFVAAADATMNVMVSDLETIAMEVCRPFELSAEALDLLLFELLQELLFYKDAEQLLLRVSRVNFTGSHEAFHLHGETCGERVNAQKHDLVVDVKAVTLHRFRVEETPRGWMASVILDI